MAFGAYGTGNKSEGKKMDVDFDALNKYVIETAQLESPEVLIGTVVGLVDLGIQSQEDAEIPFTGTPQDELDMIDDKPDTYFKDGIDPKTKKPVRYKCFPQKAIQSVAFAVDFPDIILDKGQFFGDKSGELKPLRLWLGGQFYNMGSKQMQIARPTPLRITKNPKNQWTFNNLHLCHKMAVAAKLIANDGVFLPQDIDKLVGQSFQFEVQVYNKENKGKSYYTERVAFKAGLGRGQEAPDLPTDTFIVQFNEPNDEKMLKELRSHVINTIRAAKNYDGSPVQKQLEAAKSYSKSNDEVEDIDDVSDDEFQETPPVAAKPTRTARKPKVVFIEDDGSPF